MTHNVFMILFISGKWKKAGVELLEDNMRLIIIYVRVVNSLINMLEDNMRY